MNDGGGVERVALVKVELAARHGLEALIDLAEQCVGVGRYR
jgi:hypothetical protein